jgi:hypothetical protein
MRRWKDLPYLWIGRINIVQMAIPPKAIYMLNAMPIKILMIFCIAIEKYIYLSFYLSTWKCNKHQIATAILSKNFNAGNITMLNFKLYYITIKYSIVLSQQQRGRPLHQNRRPRQKPMHL